MLALDFGTSNTVVAYWGENVDPCVLALPELSRTDGTNPPLIPTQIYVEDARQGRVRVGQAVSDRGLDSKRDPRFFNLFKRGIGAEVQGFVPELDGVAVTPELAGQWFLQAVVAATRSHLGDAAETTWVMTAPVDSFEAYRQWLSRTGASLGIDRLQLLDEPTAAALDYGIERSRHILVVDFGGGTLDLSLVQPVPRTQRTGNAWGAIVRWGSKALSEKRQQQANVQAIAKAAQTLGGADIDRWLAEQWSQQHGIEINRLVVRLAERVKIQLSECETAKEVYFDDETFVSLELSASQDEFETLMRDRGLFDRLETALQRTLVQAQQRGIDREAIEAVVAVGGTCRVPAIRAWLETQFDRDRVFTDRPLSSVALGALQLKRNLEVRDFLYHSYGVRYWNHQLNCHDWHPLIQAGLPYPLPQPVELILGASAPNQERVELIVGELGRADEGADVFFENGQLVARSRSGINTETQSARALNDSPGQQTLATLDPVGQPGSDRLRLLFQVDSERRLCVTVEDLLSGRILLDDKPLVALQ
ncbi:MAG: Hsp70 family protein [Cyanobacteria bacterium J06639_1]